MPTRVLILCTGNSARSQMAHGLLQAQHPDFEVHSAGTHPAPRVHPAAVEAMREAGIDISTHFPKNVDRYLNQPFDFVITVCGHASETCPSFTGPVGHRLHIEFEDPAAATGPAEQILAEFRRIRDEIRLRLVLPPASK